MHPRLTITGLAVLAPLFACAPLTSRAEETAPAAASAETATGVIVGRIFEEGSGYSLSGATVQVEGGNATDSTDIGGNFRLREVPEGARTVIVSKEGYQSLRIENLSVSNGGSAEVNASLKPVEIALNVAPPDAIPGSLSTPLMLETMSVDAESLQASAADFVALRQQAVGSVDSISAQEFSKFVGNDVTDVLGRIPGVSVAKGQFAVIRGLSERYNATTLNGIQLPSADPERQSVQLDIFPTRLLDGIVVSKSFTPNLAGNASGGAVDLQTNAFPAKRETVVTLGLGIDEGVFSGDDYLTYGGGTRDWMALGSQTRARAPENFTAPSDTPMLPKHRDMPVGPRFSIYHGDTIDLDDDGRAFGYNVALTYDTSYGGDETLVTPTSPALGELGRGTQSGDTSYRAIESEENVLIGALGTFGLRLSDTHQITATGFISQNGIDSTQNREDITIPGGDFPTVPGGAAPAYDEFRHQFKYQERNLSLGSLAGRHAFTDINGAQLDWSGAYMVASQDEPDFRIVRYRRGLDDGRYALVGATGAGAALSRFWRNTSEIQRAFNSNWKQPFELFGMDNASVDIGASLANASRRYEETSLLYSVSGTRFFEQPSDFNSLLDASLLAPSAFKSNSSARREVSAAYGMVTLPVTRKVKVSGGVRAEKTESLVRGIGRFGNFDSLQFYFYNPLLGVPISEPYINEYVSRLGQFTESDFDLTEGNIAQTDYLPAALLTYSPTEKANLRLAYSRTIARPSFRELGSYFTFDPADQIQHGNAGLQLSEVENWDIRFEYFFGGSDLIALSLFAKEIANPIEKVTTAATADFIDTWFNNPNPGTLRGVEFEARKGLDFIDESLRWFSLGGNVSLLDAEVKRTEAEILSKQPYYGVGVEVPGKRRLFDQPKWLVNTDLTFAHEPWGTTTTLALFGTSDVLDSIGLRSFDRFQKGYFSLDWTFTQKITDHLRFRISARNLLDPDRKRIYDPEEAITEIVERRWKDGRSYTVSMTYEF